MTSAYNLSLDTKLTYVRRVLLYPKSEWAVFKRFLQSFFILGTFFNGVLFPLLHLFLKNDQNLPFVQLFFFKI